MKIRINVFYYDLKKEKVKNDSEAITLKEVLTTSLMNAKQDEKDMARKYARFSLLMLLTNSKDVAEITSEQISDLKELVCECYNVLVYGQTCDYLEDKETNKR